MHTQVNTEPLIPIVGAQDYSQSWGAADGFNVMAPTLPYDLQDFVALVIPELQRRGLFRTAYTGRTLREHLGLPRPAHPAQLRRRTLEATPQGAALAA